MKCSNVAARNMCILIALLAALVIPGRASAAAAPIKPASMTKINIGVTSTRIVPFWDLYVATDQGYFARNNLDPNFIVISTPAALTAAAVGGSTNFVCVATDAVVSAIDAGADLKMIAGQALPLYSLVTHPSITSYSQLKGKKIAVANPNTGSTLMLLLLLRKNGVARDDVTLVQSAGTPQRLVAVESGAVAATLLSPPDSFRAEDSGLRVLGNTATVMRQYQHTVHAVNTDWANRQRPAAVAYVRAIRSAQQFLWNPANKGRAIEIFRKWSFATQDYAERTYQQVFVQYKTSSVNARIETTAINNVFKLMHETGVRLADGGVRKASTYYDPSFLASSLPAVTMTNVSASGTRGVISARIVVTREATASLRVMRNGRTVGKTLTTKLRAGRNIRGLPIPVGSRKGLTLVVRVTDAAGNTVTKRTPVKF